jgi:hypothetical protein
MTVDPNKYYKGQWVRLAVPIEAPFKLNGSALDPTQVVCITRNPVGLKTTKTYGIDIEVVKDGVGYYHRDILLDVVGEWWYRWEGHGAVEAVIEASLYVEPSLF